MANSDHLESYMSNMRERTGQVDGTRLEAFIYTLLRDHVPAGKIEQLMLNMSEHDGFQFTNGWLAEYAKDVAARLIE